MRPRTLTAMLVALASGPALAQQILFAESFDGGIPTTWVHVALGVPFDPWRAGTSPTNNTGDVYHEWFCNHGGLTRHNLLVSPPIDLRGYSHVEFACSQFQTFPLQRSVNRVEVSIDGGLSFSLLYEENGTWSGPGLIQANLDAVAGQADVRVAFRYEGAVANEWRIDDVRVSSPQPGLVVQGLSAGTTANFVASGCTPGAFVVFGLSVAGPGPLPSPWGPVGLSTPIEMLPLQIADASGSATMSLSIPGQSTGIALFAQAMDVPWGGPLRLSNALAATVP